MHILSRKEMADIDRHVINEYKIPGRVLMELAGKGCFDFIRDRLQGKPRIAIFCGTGNNGGDGLVVARWLKNYSFLPTVYLVGDKSKMSAETKSNYLLIKKVGIPIVYLESLQQWNDVKASINEKEYDAYVEALFGIGFRGSLPELYAAIINEVNTAQGCKIALDISGGLDSDNGLAENAFKAEHTLTMAAPKYGHYFGKGREYSGEVTVIDIGVPKNVWQDKKPEVSLVNDDNYRLPVRHKSAHKGDYGRIAVIAGSAGYTGAAVLCCKAALKSGAGLISLYHPPGLETIFETGLIEVMTKPFDFTKNVKQLSGELNANDVLLVGPGMRVSDSSVAIIDLITKSWEIPAVFDADALNILADHPEWLTRLQDKPYILTPHLGEFARLANISIEDLLNNPIDYVDKFVRKYRCAVLLKSSYRLYADMDTKVLDISGNDGLATGGSGDVLAGIIASFLGQKSSLADAAVAASYTLGKTAERCSEEYFTPAVTPTMIIDNLFKKNTVKGSDRI